MSRGRPRPERRPGWQERDPVPAGMPVLDDVRDWRDLDDPPDGSASVREPRRPRPVGPVSGAGAKPMPVAEFGAVLAETEPPVGACWA